MSSYLAYSYSRNLTAKERDEIDLRTKKSREEFSRGFSKGLSISVVVYSVYSLVAPMVANALEPIKNPGSTVPEGTPGQGGPATTQGGPATNQVCPAPTPNQVARPGFKPLSDGSRGALVGAVGTICATAAQSGDFLLGLAFAGLLVIGGIITNRPPHSQ